MVLAMKSAEYSHPIRDHPQESKISMRETSLKTRWWIRTKSNSRTRNLTRSCFKIKIGNLATSKSMRPWKPQRQWETRIKLPLEMNHQMLRSMRIRDRSMSSLLIKWQPTTIKTTESLTNQVMDSAVLIHLNPLVNSPSKEATQQEAEAILTCTSRTLTIQTTRFSMKMK